MCLWVLMCDTAAPGMSMRGARTLLGQKQLQKDAEKHRGVLPPQQVTSAQVLPGPFHVRTKVTVGQGTCSCKALPDSGGCWELLRMPTALGSALF